MGLGGAAFQDADWFEWLQPFREIPVFNLGVVCKRSKQKRLYDIIWNRGIGGGARYYKGFGGRAPQGAMGLRGAAFQDADWFEQLQPLREIPVFNLGAVYKRSTQKRIYGII